MAKNRAMAAKRLRASKEIIASGHAEFSKAGYINCFNRAETRATIEASDREVVPCPEHEARGLSKDVGRCGKGGRTRSTKCYGNGFRHEKGAVRAAMAEISHIWPLYVKA